MKHKILVILIPLIFISFSTSAQRGKLERAYETYEAGEYYEAIDLLKDAYNLVNDKAQKTRIVFNIGECYRLTNNPKKAEMWYRKAISRDYPDPVAILYLAEAMKMNEKYEEAIEEFRKFSEQVPDDPRGEDGIKSCRMALAWMDNPNGYSVEDMKYFNSRENDYCPFYAKDDYSEVYFTSSREASIGNDTHGATGQSFSDIFVSKMDRKGKWSTPVPLGEDINTEFEEGTPYLTDDYNTMYFTKCEVSKNKTLGCAIYEAQRSGEEWSKPKMLEIGADSIVIAHPAISPDGLTLYFVSDMEGSVGGKDIWLVKRESQSGEWGEPENMGEQINTIDDEVFPYVHPDGTFYFSSNGHIGMGGLDIFKATKTDDGDWKVENMRYPINSFADDFGIVFEADVERGFFTSSRSIRGDDEIFSFYLPPLKFNIIGSVRDSKSEEPIENATIKSVGSDGVTLETKSGDEGTFKFMLKPNTDYVFIGSAEGYLNGKERETTKGLDKSKDFNTIIYLTSIAKPIELSNSDVFYDLDKWELRPEALVSLDKLIETLNDNPNITIELMAHTDSRGSEEYNINLSQKRAQAVVDYLIEKGIASDRLTAKGYGESMPKVVDENINTQFPFLRLGQKLDEEYINSLSTEEYQEAGHQINRRTEFRVLRTDYNL